MKPGSAKKKISTASKPSVLSGFGGSGAPSPQPTVSSPVQVNWPDADVIKSYTQKNMKRESYPRPDDCIVDLVNSHLKVERCSI